MADTTLSDLDLDLVAALQHAPRAPFESIAQVLGTAPRTIGRHYHSLASCGVVRVICELDWTVLAEGPPVHLWIHTVAGQSHAVAEALSVRPDTTFVSVATGRSDVFCTLHAMTDSMTTQALTVDIPSITGVVSTNSEWVVRRLKSASAWRLPRLSESQISALTREHVTRDSARLDGSTELSHLENAVLQMLRKDARISFSDVARSLRIPEARARRLTRSVLESGLVRPRVEVEPRLLGDRLEVVLSITCHPPCLNAVASTLTGHASARFVTMTAGTSTLIYQGVFEDERALARFFCDELGANEGVANFECAILLRVLKRYWSMPAAG